MNLSTRCASRPDPLDLRSRRRLRVASVLAVSAAMLNACELSPPPATVHRPPSHRHDTSQPAPSADVSSPGDLRSTLDDTTASHPSSPRGFTSSVPAYDAPAARSLEPSPPREGQHALPPGPASAGHGVSVWSPRPGERLSSQEHPLITVRGALDERWRSAQVLVNGRRAALSGEGHFQAAVTPRVGVQHLVIEVTGESQEEPVEVAMDVFWADHWSSPAQSQPLHARLGPEFWTRGVEGVDDARTSSAAPGDLSELLEASLRDALVHEAWRAHRREAPPAPWELRRWALGEVDVFLEPHAGTLNVMIALSGVSLTLSGRGGSGDQRAPRPFEADARADMAVTARLRLTTNAQGGLELRPQPPMEVELYSLRWRSGRPEELSRVDMEALDDDLRDMLRGELAPSLLSASTSVLGALTEVLDVGSAALTWPGSRSAPVPRASWRSISLLDGALSAALDVSIEQGVDGPLEVPRGVRGEVPSARSGGRGVQVALPVDVLNEVSAGLWHHGDIDDVLWRAAASDPARVLDAGAPPMWMMARSAPLVVASPQGAASPLRLELGQVLVRPGSQGPTLGATVTADATLIWRAGRLVLSVSPRPTVRLWPWRPTPRSQWREQAARVRPWLTEALGRELSALWSQRPLWGPGDPVLEVAGERRQAQWRPDASVSSEGGWVLISSQVSWPALE